MGFKEFLTLDEARVAESQRIIFDDKDFEFLKGITKDTYSEKINWLLVAGALEYRYSPAVLQNPDPEIRTFTIRTTDLENKKKIIETYNLNVHSHHLIEKLSKTFDVNKIAITRGASRKTSADYIHYISGHSKKIPSLSPAHALLGKEEKLQPSIHKDHIKSAMVRKKIFLTPEDKKFLNYCEREIPIRKINLFMLRYSDTYFKMPQSKIDQTNFTLNVGGKIYHVPMNIKALKNHLDELKIQGIDFYKTPMSRSTAERFIQRGWIIPAHKAKSNDNFVNAPHDIARTFVHRYVRNTLPQDK